MVVKANFNLPTSQKKKQDATRTLSLSPNHGLLDDIELKLHHEYHLK